MKNYSSLMFLQQTKMIFEIKCLQFFPEYRLTPSLYSLISLIMPVASFTFFLEYVVRLDSPYSKCPILKDQPLRIYVYNILFDKTGFNEVKIKSRSNPLWSCKIPTSPILFNLVKRKFRIIPRCYLLHLANISITVLLQISYL